MLIPFCHTFHFTSLSLFVKYSKKTTSPSQDYCEECLMAVKEFVQCNILLSPSEHFTWIVFKNFIFFEMKSCSIT